MSDVRSAGAVTRLLVSGSIVAMLLGACSPAARLPVGQPGTGTTLPGTGTTLPGTAVSSSAPDPTAETELGATDVNQVVDFSLSLVLPGAGDLAAFEAGLYDPSSPNYRHFLDAAAFGARFGLPAADVDAVVGWLGAHNVTVLFEPPQRTSLTVRARAGDINQLFGVTLTDFVTADGQHFHRPLTTPTVPASVAGRVAAVVGLDNEPLLRPAFGSTLYRAGVPNGGMRPDEVARAYEIDALHSAGMHGEGQTVAVISFDTFYPADIKAFDKAMGITAPAVESIKVIDAPDTPVADNDEVTLDIEVIRGIAPAAHILNYEASNKLSNFGPIISKIVADGHADLVNISWGKCEKYFSPQVMAANEQEIAAAFAAGITFFVAAGDDGAYDCRRNKVSSDPLERDLSPNVDAPSSSPNVVSVGGTFLTVRQDGSYFDEAGWEDPLGGGGGGGGLSTVYQRPSWQQGTGVDNGQSNGMRQMPDVAGPADPTSGFIVIYTPVGKQQETTGIGGTSAAAPFWVGSMALTRQLASAHGVNALGALGPLLYQIAAARPDVFHDVVRGGNLLAQAGPGWDYSTGLGTPRVSPLADAIVAALGGH